MMRALLLTASMLAILVAAAARGEDRFGMPVYPGATYDAATTDFLVNSFHMKAACFRTKDPIAKVLEFYKSQKQVVSVSMPDKENGLAQFPHGNHVALQSPWRNMSSGAMMSDTLITIVENANH